MKSGAANKLLPALGTMVLLCLCNPISSAQTGSALSEVNAVKFANGSILDTNAYMAFGLTLDGGNSYVTSAGSDVAVEIRGEIHPEPEHIGHSADLFMVIRLEDNTWWMKDENGNWLEWPRPVKLFELVPFGTDVTLTPTIEATFVSDMITQFTGKLRLFLAYADPDGALQLNPVPHRVTISNGNNEEMAFTLFKENISPNIIFGSCIACHNDGSFTNNPQFNAPYQYVYPNDPDYLTINFEILKTLLASRGKEYILDKASGRILHYGGRQLPGGSQQYKDFETFLTLLDQ